MGDDHTPNDEQEETDRAAILARRRTFVSAAMTMVGTALLTGALNACEPQPCLSVDATSDGGIRDADAGPQPCLSVDASPFDAGPQPCLSPVVDVPMPDDATPMDTGSDDADTDAHE